MLLAPAVNLVLSFVALAFFVFLDVLVLCKVALERAHARLELDAAHELLHARVALALQLALQALHSDLQLVLASMADIYLGVTVQNLLRFNVCQKLAAFHT